MIDALNRLATVTDASNRVTTYGYDAAGNRTSVAYPNGNLTGYTYDALNRLLGLTTRDAANAVISSYGYTLDAAGHRSQVIEASGATTTYGYDDLYRLTGETLTGHPVLGTVANSYTYDAVGNRTYSVENGVSTAYTYDANDRLLTAGGETTTYDANGNTLTVAIDATLTTHTYDTRNRLVRSVKQEGGVTVDDVSYQYDADGLRVAKNDDGVETRYLLDKNRDYAQVLKELDAANTPTVSYLYGDDLIRQTRAANDSYYLYDGLGSTRALANGSGVVTDTYDYSAYGDLIDSSGATENSYRFTGEQWDANLGNYYLRARYYDPRIGRFTQMDAWMGNSRDPRTLHKYTYGNGDPVNSVDPSGKFGLSEFAVTSNIVGFLTSLRIENAFDTFDLLGIDDPRIDAARTANRILGLAALGGAGFQIIKMLSKKARDFALRIGSKKISQLRGGEFEEYLKTLGGPGPFKKGGREFDGAWGNIWIEAKSGNEWKRLLSDTKALARWKSVTGDAKRVANENGASYLVVTNSTIPGEIKDWLTLKSIRFIEMLD